MKSRLFLYTSTNSHRNQAFRYQVKAALEQLEISCPFIEIASLDEAIFDLQDTQLPALILDETIVCQGQLPPKHQLLRSLAPLLAQQIVVPTDFSKVSQTALRIALGLGQKWGTEVKALHVQSGLVYADHPMVVEPMEAMGDALQKRLDEFVDLTCSELANLNIPVEREVAIGGPVGTITQVSREPSTALMIQSIEGLHTGNGIGPVAGRLLERSECPVLFIKEEASEAHFDRMLVATDYANLSPTVLSTLHYYATSLGSELHFVHVLEPDELSLNDAQAQQSALRERLEELGFPTEKTHLSILDGQDIGVSLDQYAFDNTIDVQVMIHTRRSIWGRLFAPSMTRRELRNGYCSVLVLKE